MQNMSRDSEVEEPFEQSEKETAIPIHTLNVRGGREYHCTCGWRAFDIHVGSHIKCLACGGVAIRVPAR